MFMFWGSVEGRLDGVRGLLLESNDVDDLLATLCFCSLNVNGMIRL